MPQLELCLGKHPDLISKSQTSMDTFFVVQALRLLEPSKPTQQQSMDRAHPVQKMEITIMSLVNHWLGLSMHPVTDSVKNQRLTKITIPSEITTLPRREPTPTPLAYQEILKLVRRIWLLITLSNIRNRAKVKGNLRSSWTWTC